MGLADRDYLRDAERSSSRVSGPGWSVTTWLIVICVAVFVLDGFLPRSLVMVRNDLQLNPQLRQLRPENFAVTEFRQIGPLEVERIVVLKENGIAGGKQVFQRISRANQRPVVPAAKYYNKSTWK